MSVRHRAGKVREPCPRHGHTAVVVGDHAYLWGGMRSDLPTEHSCPTKKKMHATIDVFSLVNGNWSQQETLGEPPLGVAGYACAALRKDIYYFGGICGHGNCYHNSVHHLGTNTLHWTLVRAVNESYAPIKKWGSGMVVLEGDGEALLLVIGGFGNVLPQSSTCKKYKAGYGGVWTSEIHLFMPKSGNWTDTTFCGEPIPAMYAFTLTKIASNGAILYGGYPVDGQCSKKVYVLEYTEKQLHCHEQKIRSRLWPVARQNHMATRIHGMTDHVTPLLLVAGGEDCQLTSLSDCWILNLESWEWQQVTIPEGVGRRTSSSVSAFQIGPQCVWLLFFGGLLEYLTDKDERHQPMIAKTELLELRQESNGKWVANNAQKLLPIAIIDSRSEWVEAVTGTMECLQQKVSESVQLGEKKAQLVSQKLAKEHHSQLQRKESEVVEAKTTARRVSLQAEELSNQLSLVQLQEQGLRQELSQYQEKVRKLEDESQLSAQHHEEEVTQLKQELQAVEDQNKTLLSKVQQQEKQLLEMEQLISQSCNSGDGIPPREPPAPRVERQLPVVIMDRSSGTSKPYRQSDVLSPESPPPSVLPANPTLSLPQPPRVSPKLFQVEVIYSIPNRWCEFAINVEVDMKDIRRIESLYRDPRRQFLEIYFVWETNLTPPLTWPTIVNILEVMEEKKLSKDLRDKYINSRNC